MTLSRQLITLICVTFALIFSGTFWISLDNTRAYLMLQLAAQTQNAADSLGLSLVPYMYKRDIAAMDTMVNAVFDSGYYQSLKLETISGKALITRENTNRIEGVPAWFTATFTLDTPRAESVITTGWNQAGRLILVANPGLAYKKLWDSSIAMLQWSLAAFFAALIAALLILRAILKPLTAVEQQALAISRQTFTIVDDIPRTRELKRVVLAMNGMSEKIEGFIDKLTRRAEQLRRELHQDSVTGLVNRKGFVARLENVIQDPEKGGAGALVLIRISHFSAFNEQFGRAAGNDLLLRLGASLSSIVASSPDATVARITGTDFAVILPLADAAAASEFGTAYSNTLNSLAASLSITEVAQAGIAFFDHDSDIGSTMADADAALARAEHAGGNAFAIQTGANEAGGNLAWKELIMHAMQHDQITLLSQGVFNVQRQPLYREVLVRIQDDQGGHVSPASFTCMAERLGLSGDLDRYVIEQASGLLEQNAELVLGINLSGHSIRDISFTSWMGQYFSRHGHTISRLLFELTEYDLLQDIEASQQFIAQVHASHGKIVMEHFGMLPTSFQNLRQLKVDYIKLDGSYIRNIAEHADNRDFIESVVDVASGLNVAVIAEHVESEKDFDCLSELHIHALQGYCFGKPEEL